MISKFTLILAAIIAQSSFAAYTDSVENQGEEQTSEQSDYDNFDQNVDNTEPDDNKDIPINNSQSTKQEKESKESATNETPENNFEVLNSNSKEIQNNMGEESVDSNDKVDPNLLKPQGSLETVVYWINSVNKGGDWIVDSKYIEVFPALSVEIMKMNTSGATSHVNIVLKGKEINNEKLKIFLYNLAQTGVKVKGFKLENTSVDNIGVKDMATYISKTNQSEKIDISLSGMKIGLQTASYFAGVSEKIGNCDIQISNSVEKTSDK